MACFGEFMPHRIAGGGRKGKVHKDNIRVQFCMLYFAWEQHLFLLSFSSEVKPRDPPDVHIPQELRIRSRGTERHSASD